MQVVSAQDFATDVNRYFDMARREQLLVNDGKYTFEIAFQPEQPILEPDDDFRSAITADELKKRMHVSIRNFFADKQ
ncbi:MAG: hypothetical protein FWG79_03895 [Bacteroidales bacterium]|nr:hypothetical protein [Bacteroidales bacterium]